MKIRIGTRSLKDVLMHAGLAAGVLMLLSFTFFYGALPYITNKDKIVTVPDVSGMSFDKATRFLVIKDLDYEVTDSAYNAALPPLAVLEQYPRPMAKVKISRKIGLVLNAKKPPAVRYPELTGATLDFARKQLNAMGLKIGRITYKPDWAFNTVLHSEIGGVKVSEGQLVTKGSEVDLTIGSPTDKPFPLPDFTGMRYDDVELILIQLDLAIGQVYVVDDSTKEKNIIQQQHPSPGDTVKRYDTIDLWVSELTIHN